MTWNGTQTAVRRIGTPATTAPTDKQLSFITRLCGERGVEPVPTVRDKWEASALIDDLMKRRPVARPQAETTPPAVADGRYAIDGPDGALRFYRVNSPTEGPWSGFTFVDVIASDDRWPVKNRDAKAAILAAIAVDPMAAMLRYGQEIGACGHCGRTLTDADSRARGIGPVCAARYA